MKNATQITFAFQDPPETGENAGVGVRIKSLKKAAEQVSRDKQETEAVEVTEVQGQEASVAEASGRSENPINATSAGNDGLSEDPLLPVEENNISNAETEKSLTNGISGDANSEEPIFFQSGPQPSEAPEQTMLSDESLGHGYPDIESTMGNPPVELSVEESESPVKPTKSTRGRKSLKTIDEGADLINIPPDEILFQKQYYAIGEVAEMFGVNQSLLRFWETEFDIIQPRKNRKGDRHFRPVDIKNLLLIHDLLRRRKLTIEGAKDFLKKNKRSPERFAMIQSLQKIKGFILEIKATL